MNLETLRTYHAKKDWAFRIESTRDLLEFCYIDWVNDFLTYEYYAEYFGLTIGEATRLLNLGRAIHYKRQED